MLTVRNEHEPFVGPGAEDRWFGARGAAQRRATFDVDSATDWEPTTIESPLAEVVWYAIENPERR